MSNANNKKTETVENTEKKLTKYDRKMQARKEAELLEKRRSLITKISLAVIAAAIILVAVLTPIIKRASANKEYIKIGNHSISQKEFEFYYGYSVNTFLNQYASILPYMGLDTSQSFANQQFSEELTWEEYFRQMAASNIRQYTALSDDAAAKGYTYDVTEDYNEFWSTMEQAATESNVSLNTYLQSAFGSYATKSSLEKPVKNLLMAESYYTHLIEQNAPENEEILAYYEENKNSYDKVSYRVFGIAAKVGEDDLEETITAAMEEAKQKAEHFIENYSAGHTFAELCLEYATEDNIDTYKDESASLRENASYSVTSTVYRDWLFEEGRRRDDISVFTDDDNHIAYVVYFLSREKDDTADDSISDTLAAEATQKYLSDLVQGYEIVDKKDHLHFVDTSDSGNLENSDNENNPVDGENPEE